MWPDRRLCELFQVEHPIIQAPMLRSCKPALAAAVTGAGALGSLGCALMPPEELRAAVAEIRSRTNGAFNLNFFVTESAHTEAGTLAAVRDRLRPWYDRYGLGAPPVSLPEIGPAFDAEHLDVLLELRPPVVSFHFGHPGAAAVTALRDAGSVVIASATCTAEARALEAAGVDAIIAQGWEAGGHRGSFAPTPPGEGIGGLALIPQIADAVDLPVIAAGGIADGRGIAAAFALGASGVQMGTAFLTCPEAATEEARRARIRSATDADTMFIDAVSGRSARGMRSVYAEQMVRSGAPVAGFLQMYALSRPILDAAPDEEASFLLYGQTAALNRDMPAAELVRVLCEEALARMAALSGG